MQKTWGPRMKYFITAFLFLLSVDSYGQFRSTDWGDSVEEVKQIESFKQIADTLLMGRDILVYEGKVNYYDTNTVYYFIEDTLYRGRYYFDHFFFTNTPYLNAYEDISDILTDVHGDPDLDEIICEDEKDETDYSSLSNKISFGDCYLKKEWITDETEITHVLDGEDLEFIHTLDYYSIKHKYLEDELEKKIKERDF